MGRGSSSGRVVSPGPSGSSLMWLSSSQTHWSQQLPSGRSSWGREQRQLGSGTWCGHRGMQPTTRFMQVHWCWQLGWKCSPCWYIRPSNSQGKPRASALHRPRRGSPPAPRWQRSPLMWSQGSEALQSSLYCFAQTLQQPQWSSTQLTPRAQRGGEEGQEHSVGHSLSARTAALHKTTRDETIHCNVRDSSILRRCNKYKRGKKVFQS